MRSLIGQQSNCFGIAEQQKKEVVTTGAGTAGYAKQTGRPICDGSKK